MADDRVRATLEMARALEAAGKVDAAVAAYMRVAAVEQAAQVLMTARRFGEAARLLLESLPLPASRFGELDHAGKKIALRAGICLAHAGDVRQAIDIFLAIDEVKRAADMLEQSGDPVGASQLRNGSRRRRYTDSEPPPAQPSPTASIEKARELEKAGQLELALRVYLELEARNHAGRVLRKLGRPAEAARLFVQLAMPYEAGVCFEEAKSPEAALAQFVRVASNHHAYRDAAVRAIRLAWAQQYIDFAFDHFISPIVVGGPRDPIEAECFYQLGRLYETSDFPENAREVYESLLRVRPGFRDAASRLERLARAWAGTREQHERILQEDQRFRKGARAMPELPDLPDLPPLPEPGGAGAAAPGRAGGPTPRTVSSPAVQGPTLRADAGAPEQQRPASAPPADDGLTLAPGTLVEGRYRIDRKLGAGGMAAVYEALDLELDERIAIKLFALSAGDESLVARFKQELLLTRKLSHPNVVRLFDIGTHRGCKFITMELLRGSDLASVLEQCGALDLPRGAHYLIQACEGLYAAHGMGVVHRDIKPANFFVTGEDTLKVMDFGLAKRQANKGLTVAGFMAGTPAYMAPEQIRDFASADHRADIYALGVVAFEVFTGRVPFDSPDMMGILGLHLAEPPPSPSSINPSISPPLEALILQLLQKDPARRVQDCREIAVRLRQVVQSASQPHRT